MSGFLANLHSRHNGLGINIEPRQKSRYEANGSSGIEAIENVNSIPNSSTPYTTGQTESMNQSINAQEEYSKNPVLQSPQKKYTPEKQKPAGLTIPASRQNQSLSEGFRHEMPELKSETGKKIHQSSDEGRFKTQNIIPPPQDKTNPQQIKLEQHPPKSLEGEQIINVEKKPKPIANPAEKRFQENRVFKNDTFAPSFVSEIKIKKEKSEPGQLMPPPGTQTVLIQQSDSQTAKSNRQTNNISSASEETTVKVSIGKIEIKAINQTPSERITKRKPAPIMSLEEYLNNQNKNHS